MRHKTSDLIPFSPRRLLAALAAVLALSSVMVDRADAAPRGSRVSPSGRAWNHNGANRWHGHPYWRGGVILGAPPLFADPFWYERFPGYPAQIAPPLPPAQYIEADPAALQQQPPAPVLSDEERARRLDDMCAHGVFSRDECVTRRAELLQAM